MRINLDNSFIRIMSGIFDVAVTFLLFIVCCLPVVTIGASATAMHATMLSIAEDTCSGVLKKFFGSFKLNFKLSTKAWLVLLAVGAVVAVDVIVCFGFEMESETTILNIMRGITVFCVALYTCMLVYVFAGIAKFEVTFKQAFRNALIFITKFPLTTLGILVINVAVVFCVYMTWIWGLPVVILLVYLQEWMIHKVFDKTLGIKREKRKAKEETMFYE